MSSSKSEPMDNSKDISTEKLNKLRAAVLGANDGIVSTASVVMGVAGATNNKTAIVTAGLAALVAGALSMAVGEYVSVSSQSDAEKAYIKREKAALKKHPKEQLQELTQAYIDRGVNKSTAIQVAKELTAKDALKAHLHIEFSIDEDDMNSPMHAAIASLLAFTAGGLVPFLAIVLAPDSVHIWVTALAVLAALLVTGYISAKVGGADKKRAIIRVVLGGMIAMLVTYYVGVLFGATVL